MKAKNGKKRPPRQYLSEMTIIVYKSFRILSRGNMEEKQK